MGAAETREEAPPLPPDPYLERTFADRYRVTGFIGRGGMGAVYEAVDESLHRTVAIKVMMAKSGAPDATLHERFFREAKACAALSHPNVVTVHDFGMSEDGVYFLVMERLVGVPLNQFIGESGVLPPNLAARFVIDIAAGLSRAHKADLVHRDMKPSNVFLSNPGEADWSLKVLDFGIVKMPESPGKGLTKTGALMGSPHYMSPEQIIGVHVDQRSDVYSLGILLYRLLVGKTPFEEESDYMLMDAHIRRPPKPVTEANASAEISPELDKVVLRCLEKDRFDRFLSMQDLITALEACPEIVQNPRLSSPISGRPGVIRKNPGTIPSGSSNQTTLDQPTPGTSPEVDGAVSAQRLALRSALPATSPEATSERKRNRVVWAAAAILLLVGSIAAVIAATRAPNESPSVAGETDRTATVDADPEPDTVRTPNPVAVPTEVPLPAVQAEAQAAPRATQPSDQTGGRTDSVEARARAESGAETERAAETESAAETEGAAETDMTSTTEDEGQDSPASEGWPERGRDLRNPWRPR